MNKSQKIKKTSTASIRNSPVSTRKNQRSFIDSSVVSSSSSATDVTMDTQGLNYRDPSVIEYISTNFKWELEVDLSEVDTDDYAFEGFNPAVIKRMVIQTPNFSKTDIAILLSVCAHIGPNILTYQKKLKPQSALTVGDLISKYGIVNKPRVRSKTTLTMQRLQSAFPIIAARVAQKIGMIDGLDTDCPPAYRFPAAASIIDRTDEHLKSLFRDWAILFDRKINGGKGDQERVINYLRVMNESDFVPQDVRRAFAAQYNPFEISRNERARHGLSRDSNVPMSHLNL